MGLRDFSHKDTQQIKNEFEKFSSFSQNELMSELIKRVSESKRNGTFDKDSLLQFVSVISPRLTDEERQRLKNLVNSL